MKINFDNLPLKTNADKKTAYGITKTEQGAGRTQALRSGKMLTDISGIVMENAALKGQGMTADESAGDLLQTMVGLQKNYMSVMSDSMSGDDISRMMDEGFSPAEVDFEEAVTIVDKIKAELVKGGNYVPGYTDDVDLEALQEVLRDPDRNHSECRGLPELSACARHDCQQRVSFDAQPVAERARASAGDCDGGTANLSNIADKAFICCFFFSSNSSRVIRLEAAGGITGFFTPSSCASNVNKRSLNLMLTCSRVISRSEL